MGISPWQQFSQNPPWTFTCNKAPTTPGGAPGPVDLTGYTQAAFALTIRNNYLGPLDAGYERPGTGTFAIADAPNGVITYAPSAADVATPGDFDVLVKFTLSNGTPFIWPPTRFVVERS